MGYMNQNKLHCDTIAECLFETAKMQAPTITRVCETDLNSIE